jgi:hypothetical protein
MLNSGEQLNGPFVSIEAFAVVIAFGSFIVSVLSLLRQLRSERRAKNASDEIESKIKVIAAAQSEQADSMRGQLRLLEERNRIAANDHELAVRSLQTQVAQGQVKVRVDVEKAHTRSGPGINVIVENTGLVDTVVDGVRIDFNPPIQSVDRSHGCMPHKGYTLCQMPVTVRPGETLRIEVSGGPCGDGVLNPLDYKTLNPTAIAGVSVLCSHKWYSARSPQSKETLVSILKERLSK